MIDVLRVVLLAAVAIIGFIVINKVCDRQGWD